MNKQNLLGRLNRGISTATILALGSVFASAHPGHGLHQESVAHTLTSPYHLLTMAMIGGGLLLGAVFVKRLAARRTMQITGAAAVAVAALTFVSQMLH